MTKGKYSLEQAGDLGVKSCWKACVLVLFSTKAGGRSRVSVIQESIVVLGLKRQSLRSSSVQRLPPCSQAEL